MSTPECLPDDDELTDTERFKREYAQHQLEAEEARVRAKVTALAEGREPFDLDAMEALWMPVHHALDPADGNPTRRETQVREFEELYYQRFPKFHTIAAFAEHMKALEPHGMFD